MSPVQEYKVDVYTGSEENSSTDAEISLIIFGERGDTGRRRLVKKLEDKPEEDKKKKKKKEKTSEPAKLFQTGQVYEMLCK